MHLLSKSLDALYVSSVLEHRLMLMLMTMMMLIMAMVAAMTKLTTDTCVKHTTGAM